MRKKIVSKKNNKDGHLGDYTLVLKKMESIVEKYNFEASSMDGERFTIMLDIFCCFKKRGNMSAHPKNHESMDKSEINELVDDDRRIAELYSDFCK